LPTVYFFAYLFWFAEKKSTVIVPDILVRFAGKAAGLAALAKFRKATFSFIMSVCLSVCLSARPSVHAQQLGCHRTDLREI